jgi:hypothetical protein
LIANDREAWAERLYGRLPEVYRTRDAAPSRPLLALLRAIAGQVASVRQDLDDLWDDFFIETCDDWVVPYLGALVGARLLANPVGQDNRLEVASTLAWRRSRGTPAMLASLAEATTGWRVGFAELFASLAWVQNLNHQRSTPFFTCPLADPSIADRLGRADDPFAHIADVRPAAAGAPRLVLQAGQQPLGPGRTAWGTPGRYQLRRVGFFLRQLQPFRLQGVTPAPLAPGTRAYHFDPLGREAPLFSAASAAPISSAQLAHDPASFFGEGRDVLVRRMGVALAMAATPVSPLGSSSRPFTFGDTSPVALHPSSGLRLIEPAAFASGAARFTVRALWRTAAGDDPLGTLSTLQARLGDQPGAFSRTAGSSRAGRLVLRLETAPGAPAGRFPATVIAVRDDQVVARAALDPATRLPDPSGVYQDALLVYLPEAFLQPGQGLELHVATDGSTYRAPQLTPQSLAMASQGQTWPPADLSRPSAVATGISLHRRTGLRVPDPSRLAAPVLLEALASTGLAATPQGFLCTVDTPLAQLPDDVRRDLVLPAGQTMVAAFSYHPSQEAVTGNLPLGAVLALRLRPLGGAPSTVCPQCEVVVTDRDGPALLAYLPEVTLTQAAPEAALAVAVDGSTYRPPAALPGPGPLPASALARAAAGQVLPIEGELPLRRRTVAGGVSAEAALWLDPERGRFCLPEGDPLLALPPADRGLSVDYVEAFGDEIGARAFDRKIDYVLAPSTRVVARSGDCARDLPLDHVHTSLQDALALAADGEVIEIADSATYAGPFTLDFGSRRRLTVRAAGQPRFERPCLAGQDPVLTAAAPPGGHAAIELNGLLLGGGVRLDGPVSLTLLACTLDTGAGGAGGRLVATDPDPAHHLRHLLCRCLSGALLLSAGVERVVVADSIVDGRGGQALQGTDVQLERSTVLGRLRCRRLEASESLLEDVAEVEDRQLGCVRFSRWEPGSRLPGRYRCVPSDQQAAAGETVRPVFVSVRPASPTYCRLSGTTPAALLAASEAADQVGAFARSYPGLRLGNLQAKLQEFLPVGLTTALIAEA